MAAAKDILIIEDDKDLADSMCIILESKGHRIRIAHNGSLGFAEIEKAQPELILLDVMMATDTEGFDLAFKLKNNPRYQDIPIIIMTSFLKKVAEDGPDRFQHILNENWPASYFFEKPVDPDRLWATIDDIFKEA